jgi:hypothetical protein
MELLRNKSLVDLILNHPNAFPPLAREWERVIRCSRENVERAIARALAHVAHFSELTRIEIVSEEDVSKSENC